MIRSIGFRATSCVFVTMLCVLAFVPHVEALGSPVGYWRLNETSGNASDSSGNGVTLTNVGSVTYTTGTKGNAASFNGSNYLNSASGPDIANSSFTISLWINMTAVTGGNSDFLGIGDVSAANEALHLRVQAGSATMRIGFFANDFDVSATITPGTWHHVVVVYDKNTGRRALYLDEVLKGEQSGISPYIGNTRIMIGQSAFASWDGLIDDVRIYSSALNLSDIQAIGDDSGTNEQSSSSSTSNGPIYGGPASGLPGYTAPRPQVRYPDGTVVYLDVVPAAPVVQVSSQQNLLTQVRDLMRGLEGDDVKALQSLLLAQGYSIPAGATGYFGQQTQTALAKYQSDHDIAPAAGYFGPSTRAQMKGAGLEGLWW